MIKKAARNDLTFLKHDMVKNDLTSLKHDMVKAEIIHILELLSQFKHSDVTEAFDKIPDGDGKKDLKDLWNSIREQEIHTALEQPDDQRKSCALNLFAKRIKFCIELQNNDQLWEKLIAIFPEKEKYLGKLRASLRSEGEYLANSPKTLLKQLENLAVFEELLPKVDLDESTRSQINTDLLHEKEILEQAIVNRLKCIIKTGERKKNCPVQQALKELKEKGLLKQTMDIDLDDRPFNLQMLYLCTLIFLKSQNVEDAYKLLLLHGHTISELKNEQTVHYALKEMYQVLLTMDLKEKEQFFKQSLILPEKQKRNAPSIWSKVTDSYNTITKSFSHFFQQGVKTMNQSKDIISTTLRIF